MRRRLLFGVLVALMILLPWAVLVQAEENDPYLITENSIGPLHIGMAESEAITIAKHLFGDSYRRAAVGLPGHPPQVYRAIFDWPGGLQIESCKQIPYYSQCKDQLVIISLTKKLDPKIDPAINARLARYHTKEGIAVGDPVSKVLETYGAPLYQEPSGKIWDGGIVSIPQLAWKGMHPVITIYKEEVASVIVADPKVHWKFWWTCDSSETSCTLR